VQLLKDTAFLHCEVNCVIFQLLSAYDLELDAVQPGQVSAQGLRKQNGKSWFSFAVFTALFIGLLWSLREMLNVYKNVSKSFRPGHLERELQMVQFSATRCSCIIHLVSQSSEFCCHNPLCCFSTGVYYCKHILHYRLSPENFGCTLLYVIQIFPSSFFSQNIFVLGHL
jgi:hypothetical protein